jgi:hypothetical protein
LGLLQRLSEKKAGLYALQSTKSTMADGKLSGPIPSKPDILSQFTAEKQLPTLCGTEEGSESDSDGPCYSVLSEREKLLTVSIASLATFLSPLSASIYYPGIEAVARDLHVSNNTINLTITSFKVSFCVPFQANGRD